MLAAPERDPGRDFESALDVIPTHIETVNLPWAAIYIT